MDFLAWLWVGSDGPRMRHLRQWLESRGYRRVSYKRTGMEILESYEGSRLSIEFYLDRYIDWYVDLKPLAGNLDFQPLERWMRCVGSTDDAGIRLPPLADALRKHLAHIEAACEMERLPATIACLSRQ